MYATIITSCLVALILVSTAIAQSVAQQRLTANAITPSNIISLDYSAQGPIGGESLHVGRDKVAQIQKHNRFHAEQLHRKDVTGAVPAHDYSRQCGSPESAPASRRKTHYGRGHRHGQRQLP
jgi:hypothetical protein